MAKKKAPESSAAHAPRTPDVPDVRPRPIAGVVRHGAIELGGQPGSPLAPQALSYAGSSFQLTTASPVAPLHPSVQNRVDRWTVNPTLPNAFLPGIDLAPLPRPGILHPVNPTPIPYKPFVPAAVRFGGGVPLSASALPGHLPLIGLALLDVYLPAGTPPPTGWPVLLVTGVAGWAGSAVRGAIDPDAPNDPGGSLLSKAINAGLAVLDVGANTSGNDGNPIEPAWFYPPGHPSGRWEDATQTLPDKELVQAIQWIKDQSLYPLDPGRIFLLGISAGAQIALWIAMHPDLATPGGTSQERRDTSVAGVVALDPIASFVAQRDDWLIANPHFESVSNPGHDAQDLSDVDPDIRDQASPLRTLLRDTSRVPLVPCFVACDEPLGSDDFSLEPDEHPALRGALGTPSVHDLWNSAMLVALLRLREPLLHALRTELHVHPDAVSSLGVLAPLVTGTFPGRFLDIPSIIPFWDTVIAWVVKRAREPRLRPEGLQLHPRSGVIHGQPNLAAAARPYRVTARNAFGLTQTTVTLQVGSPAPLVP